MPNSSVKSTTQKMLFKTGINNTLAWKVTGNWEMTMQCNLTSCWLWHLRDTLICNSLHLEFSHLGLPLWRKTIWQSHTQFILFTVLCVQRTTVLLTGQRSAQQLGMAEPCLQMKQLGSSNSGKSDSFFRGNTTWGCTRVKREEAREQEGVTWEVHPSKPCNNEA